LENKLTGEPDNKKKKKIHWMLLGAAALVVIIIANIFVWRGSLDKQSQVDALKAEVTQVNQQISQGVSPPSTDLTSELTQAENDLTEALQVFPSHINGNDVIDFIISTAAQCHVELVPLAFDGEIVDTVANSVNLMKYHGTVTGTIYQTSSFLTKLQQGKYKTLVITECNVQRIIVADNPVSGDDVLVTVDFSIAIYVSPGTDNEDNAS
jgi:hypothetical protein